MTSLTKITSGALAVLLVTTTLAVAGNGGIQTRAGFEIDRGTLQVGKFASCLVALARASSPRPLAHSTSGTTSSTASSTARQKSQTAMIALRLRGGRTRNE